MHKIINGMTAVLFASLLISGCSAGDTNLTKQENSVLAYVTLGEYKGLEVEQIKEKKELSDEEKEAAMAELLESYAEQIDITDRGAQNGDCLEIQYKCYQGQELIDESGDVPVEMELGEYLYFDEEGEAQLLGTKAGDEKTIAVTEEGEGENYTYTYEITVNRVYENSIPVLDEKIAAEEGYDSLAAMEKDLYETTLATINNDYQMAAKDQLIQLVIVDSKINGYPQELYDKMYEQLDTSYQEFFGMTLEEIYAEDEQGLQSVIEEMLAQEMVVSAIAEVEKITVSQEDLDEYKQKLVTLYGYEDTEELSADFSEEDLKNSLLTDKVQEYLLAKAKVTFVDEEEYYGDYEIYDEYEDTYEDEEIFDDIVEEDLLEEEN